MVISVINQKGGVGKTATAINVGYNLHRMGHLVTFIDLDPQLDLTSYKSAMPEAVWLRAIPDEKPAGIVLLDHPPRIEQVEARALDFSDVILAPAQTNMASLRGLLRMDRDVEPLIGRTLPIRVLLTMVTSARSDVRREIEQYAGDRLCGTIPRAVDIERAQDEELSIEQYKPQSRAASAYRTLAKEIATWHY